MMLSQGAEAILVVQDDGTLVKERTSKSYRNPLLDASIRKSRTKRETNLLVKAAKLVNVPKVHPSPSSDKFSIKMEKINGLKVRDFLLQTDLDWTVVSELCEKIGMSIAKLHENDIIHGDLTTSNMIV